MGGDNAMEAVNPGGRRKCTDVLCLLIFAMFWFGMAYITYIGFTQGDPERLIYSLDYKFDQCNKDNSAEARGLDSLTQTVTSSDGSTSRDIKLGGKNLTNAPLYYVLASGGSRWKASYVGVCADSCPNEGGTEMKFKPEDWVCTGKYYGTSNKPDVSGSDWPKIKEFTKEAFDDFVDDVNDLSDSSSLKAKDQYDYLTSFFLIKDSSKCEDTSDNDDDDCTVCFPAYPSVRYGGAFCLPDPEYVNSNAEDVMSVFDGEYNLTFVSESATSIFGDAGSVTMRIVSDVRTAFPIVLACIGLAMVLGFAWAFLTRLFIKPMVIVTIVGVFLGLALATYTLYDKVVEMRASSLYDRDITFTRLADWTLGFTVFSGACLAFYMVLICCFWNKIFLATGIIIEASKALTDIPWLLFVPVAPALLTCGLFVYFVIGAFYIVTTGELKLDGNGYAAIHYDETLRGMLAYHFFGFVWTSVWLNHIGWAIIAATVVQWYFQKPRGSDLGSTPVLSAAKRVLWYHLGSIVIGSLTVAIVRFLRYMMNFLKKYVTPESKTIGWLVQYVWSCIDCCLRCFEKLLEFISRNAYILVMVESEPFCTSARHAFGYMVSNLSSLAIVQGLGDLFLWLGKFFVAIIATGVCGLILTTVPQFNFASQSIVLPCLVVFIAAYLIGSMFMGIYEMSIDSIFMCFCIDEDKQLGFADGALKDFVQANAAADAKAKDLDEKGDKELEG